MKQQVRNRDYGKGNAPTFAENENTYTPARGKKFLDMYRSGQTLAQVCSDPTMPGMRDLWKWRELDPEFAKAWDQIKSEHKAEVRNSQAEFQVVVAEEIFSQYGTGEESLKNILESCEYYPSMTTLHGWCQNNPVVREMRTAAEECKAMLHAERCVELADQLDPNDPRAVTCQIRARHWLAERLWRAKFGQQQMPTGDTDDLVNKSEKEAVRVLEGLVKELESVGINLNQNVH